MFHPLPIDVMIREFKRIGRKDYLKRTIPRPRFLILNPSLRQKEEMEFYQSYSGIPQQTSSTPMPNVDKEIINALSGRIAELENELDKIGKGIGLTLHTHESNQGNWKDSAEGYSAHQFAVTPKSTQSINESTRQEEVSKTSLALIDSRPLTRISISHLLTTLSDDFVILPYSNLDEFMIKYLERPCKVEMIVFNLGSARISENHVSSGIQRLKLELPDLPLVFLSDHDELGDILHAIQVGAHAYITSAFNPSTLVHSLRLVLEGGAFIPHNALLEISGKTPMPREEGGPNSPKVDPSVLQTLTSRESEVFELVRRGKSNKIIACELGMQESTVKVHTRKIMTKLKAINRTHAAFLGSQITENRGETKY